MAGRAVQVVRGRGGVARLQVLHLEVAGRTARHGRVRVELDGDGVLGGVLLVPDVPAGLALGERRAARRREHRLSARVVTLLDQDRGQHC